MNRKNGIIYLKALLLKTLFSSKKRIPPSASEICKVHLHSPESPHYTQAIPKIIWAFWHSTELPILVAKCIDKWRELNPDFEIYILNSETINDYLTDIPSNLKKQTIQKQTDWIRLALLHKYGGFWIDSTIILTKPLTWVLDIQRQNKSEFVGFYIDKVTQKEHYPVVESWFMAAVPQSKLIKEWFAKFSVEVIENGTENYLKKLESANKLMDFCQGIDSPEYLTIHVVIQDLLQQYSDQNTPYNLFLFKAEDSAFFYQQQAKWHKKKSTSLFLFTKINDSDTVPDLVKLIGRERVRLEPFFRYKLIGKDSFLGRYL